MRRLERSLARVERHAHELAVDEIASVFHDRLELDVALGALFVDSFELIINYFEKNLKKTCHRGTRWYMCTQSADLPASIQA